MTKYSNEKKEHALSQMSAPHNKPVAAVAPLTGVPKATLYLWRKQAREQGCEALHVRKRPLSAVLSAGAF